MGGWEPQKAGHGDFALWDKESPLVGILGTIWKEIIQAAVGELYQGLPHRLQACVFLGYRNCPTFPEGSSGGSQAQGAQCGHPRLELYIYLLWPY